MGYDSVLGRPGIDSAERGHRTSFLIKLRCQPRPRIGQRWVAHDQSAGPLRRTPASPLRNLFADAGSG